MECCYLQNRGRGAPHVPCIYHIHIQQMYTNMACRKRKRISALKCWWQQAKSKWFDCCVQLERVPLGHLVARG